LYPNFSHLLHSSRGDFVLALGDDDWIHPRNFHHATFLQNNPGYSACAGFMAALPPIATCGMTCFEDRFTRPVPVERALDYIRYSLWEQDVNWLALAIHRRGTILKYLEYMERHPFPFHFRDQMLSQIALLMGPVKGLREGFLCYSTRTPSEMASHKESHSRSLAELGLPPWLHHYYPFWLACEYATLYLWRGLPDTIFSDRHGAADSVFNEIFGRYRELYAQHPEIYEDHFEKAGIWKPMYDVLDHPSAIVGLKSLCTIFTTVNERAGNRFANFLREELVSDVLN
jgi:hypothetical protein